MPSNFYVANDVYPANVLMGRRRVNRWMTPALRANRILGRRIMYRGQPHIRLYQGHRYMRTLRRRGNRGFMITTGSRIRNSVRTI